MASSSVKLDANAARLAALLPTFLSESTARLEKLASLGPEHANTIERCRRIVGHLQRAASEDDLPLLEEGCLSGLQAKPRVNTSYSRRGDRVVAGQSTYWSTDGEHFLYTTEADDGSQYWCLCPFFNFDEVARNARKGVAMQQQGGEVTEWVEWVGPPTNWKDAVARIAWKLPGETCGSSNGSRDRSRSRNRWEEGVTSKAASFTPPQDRA
eukprot:TRINITY_DN22286_c0_g1_i1.p1 TRINITY_DN22286_c0_g1~~TRINITY_DN22286_c0_g1_i1.p1  ORF type:complete len:236 (+),score=30.31 TRINITY_DN22286_c0_g1_i1:77-709(+)